MNEEGYRGLAAVFDHAVSGARRCHSDLLGVGDFDYRRKEAGSDIVVAELLPSFDPEW